METAIHVLVTWNLLRETANILITETRMKQDGSAVAITTATAAESSLPRFSSPGLLTHGQGGTAQTAPWTPESVQPGCRRTQPRDNGTNRVCGQEAESLHLRPLERAAEQSGFIWWKAGLWQSRSTLQGSFAAGKHPTAHAGRLPEQGQEGSIFKEKSVTDT